VSAASTHPQPKIGEKENRENGRREDSGKEKFKKTNIDSLPHHVILHRTAAPPPTMHSLFSLKNSFLRRFGSEKGVREDPRVG
jgi:hypothetical protein